MLFDKLLPTAEIVVARTLQQLPEEIRALAQRLPVAYYDQPNEAILGDEFEPDILGLFVGDPHGFDTGSGNTVPPQIVLFLENIYDEAEGVPRRFEAEVRKTYLHELGHYLGWDEEDVEARGL